MKFALAFVFVAISIAVASASLTCYTDENKCAEDECCMKMTNMIYVCKKLRQADESCQMHQLKSLIKSHVYMVQCPCAEGMKCIKKDGIIGNVLGTCQSGSNEE